MSLTYHLQSSNSTKKKIIQYLSYALICSPSKHQMPDNSVTPTTHRKTIIRKGSTFIDHKYESSILRKDRPSYLGEKAPFTGQAGGEMGDKYTKTLIYQRGKQALILNGPMGLLLFLYWAFCKA